MSRTNLVGRVEHRILLIRGLRIMLDGDLAELYGVKTKVLNQAVSRNRERFPEDFMFRLTQGEKREVVTICDHLRRLKYSPTLPYAFTEHGAMMLAELEHKIEGHDQQIRSIFDAIRRLMVPVQRPRRRIGFHPG